MRAREREGEREKEREREIERGREGEKEKVRKKKEGIRLLFMYPTSLFSLCREWGADSESLIKAIRR